VALLTVLLLKLPCSSLLFVALFGDVVVDFHVGVFVVVIVVFVLFLLFVAVVIVVSGF
jgi:hypothetical protein